MIYESEIKWYKEILPELKVVFDVGCRNDNVFYDIDPTLDIHLFDPRQPAKTPRGRYNKMALSDTKGEAIYYDEYSSMEKRNLKGHKWKWLTHTTVEVKTDTLDNYCEENGIKEIDLLKIDTEGHDLKVLLGASRMLPHIKYIQFEEWGDGRTQKIMDFLKDYDIESLGGRPINYKCKRK